MSIQRRQFVAAVGSVAATGIAGCTAFRSREEGAITGETLRLTTTTSTYDTGLLDELNAPFEDRYGVTVEAIGQGTGAALETARSGDADVVMVHARALEDEFLEAGYGVNRRDLMFNDFVVVGDADDPAGISGTTDVEAAFTDIAEAESTFVSRGDNSGTHAKELEIWDAAGVGDDEFGEWYLDGGGSMGEILTQTDQGGDYTLADRGTYLSMRSDIGLETHVEGPIEDGPDLLANPYGIVAVNPAVHDNVNYDLAMAYIGYLTGLESRERIEEYAVEGEQLFFPEAVSEEPNFQQYVPEGWDGADD
ncbi:substrate-binding domain-containing protein [Natronorubrum texcoconense]|uniref:Tungstate transport system substrate-binding protein n=1 Tax=Natronorubrum texcoconense TaxID=1095776 RepID=A0A1G8YNM0_9EURY|nr:substrate-binding domain-containing protein [Natronorubrum texcoconense]SDK04361.1 tungstate transport system substrate-binding protein [Natronorubrum texcoconense]